MNFTLGFKPKFICTNCGSVANPVKKVKGSGLFEVLLYLFLVSIPISLIYSVWRRTGKESVCPHCKQTTMIPIDSPKGQSLQQAHQGK